MCTCYKAPDSANWIGIIVNCKTKEFDDNPRQVERGALLYSCLPAAFDEFAWDSELVGVVAHGIWEYGQLRTWLWVARSREALRDYVKLIQGSEYVVWRNQDMVLMER